MAITLTTTGKVLHEPLTDSISAAFDAKGSASPSFDGGVMTLDGAGWYVTHDPVTMPAEAGEKLTTRVKTRLVHTGGDYYISQGGRWQNAATQPTSLTDYMYGRGSWTVHIGAPHHWGLYDNAFIYNALHPTINTWYIYEQEHQYTDAKLVYAFRHASTIAVIGTATKTGYAFENSAWLAFGNAGSGAGHLEYDYVSVFKGCAITVTGLVADNYVTLTDPSDSVKASATAAGASVSLDATLLEFPYNGKVKVYATEGGALLDTFTGSEIYGGDSYAYSSSAVLRGPRLVTAKDAFVKLGDNAGANKFIVQDSDDTEVFAVDSDGLVEPATFDVTTGHDHDGVNSKAVLLETLSTEQVGPLVAIDDNNIEGLGSGTPGHVIQTDSEGEILWDYLDLSKVIIPVNTCDDDYLATADDVVIICNKGTAMTITLPEATGSGRMYYIKNINAGDVTVDGNGAETIDGATTQTVSQWDCMVIVDYAASAWAIV